MSALDPTPRRGRSHYPGRAMMRFMLFFVWAMVSIQIVLLIMSGGSDPTIWAGFVITLASAAYVTTVVGGR